MPAGRPSEYNSNILPAVAELALAGGTDVEIADLMKVTVKTLYVWKNKYQELGEVLKWNKDAFDMRIENRLALKALEGDITAMIFWLKNRKSKEWRDRQEHGGPDGGPIEFVVKSILEDK